MKVNDFFYTHPVFRHEEFVQWKLNQGTEKKSVNKALFYYVKDGRLLNLRRNLYAVILPGTDRETPIDPYLVAGKASNDSVLAYHTALELHGVAYTVFQSFTFLTQLKIKPFELQDRFYQPVATPLSLRSHDNLNVGIETVERQGVKILITNLERTFVDVLDRVNLSGGWEEVVRSINNIAILDLDAVIDYCLKLNSRILAAKVGFFLDQREGAFKVDQKLLKPLLEKKPITAQSLLSKGEKGRLIAKWNIILPLSVVKQSWEEPAYDV